MDEFGHVAAQVLRILMGMFITIGVITIFGFLAGATATIFGVLQKRSRNR